MFTLVTAQQGGMGGEEGRDEWIRKREDGAPGTELRFCWGGVQWLLTCGYIIHSPDVLEAGSGGALPESSLVGREQLRIGNGPQCSTWSSSFLNIWRRMVKRHLGPSLESGGPLSQ